MNRRVGTGLIAGMLALGLAVVVLMRGDEAGYAGDVLRRAGEPPAAEHGFRGEASGRAPDRSALAPASVEALAAPITAAEAAAPGDVPTRAVSGRVLRAADGTPLEGARVDVRVIRLTDEQGRQTVFEFNLDPGSFELIGRNVSMQTHGVVTDAEGRFTLRDVPIDAPQIFVGSDNAWPPRSTFYPLPAPPDDIAGLELVFDSGFELRGTVRDLRGAPLADMTVGLEPMEPVLTDASGRFAFRDVAPELGALSVQAYAEGAWYQREERSAPVPGFASDIATLDFTLTGSGAIEGIVIGPDGLPLRGAEVRLLAETSVDGGMPGAPHQRTETTADGHYLLDHVPEGRYLLLCSLQPTRAAGGLQLSTGKFDAGTFLVNVSMDGLVSLSREASASTGGGLAPRIVPDVAVEAGRATQLDIALDEGAVIEGRVFGSDGSPLPDAALRLESLVRWDAPAPVQRMTRYDGDTVLNTNGGYHGLPGSSTLTSIEQRSITDTDGRYRFDRVSAGEKLLHAIDAGQRSAPASIALDVRGTSHYPQVDFVLPLGFSLRGRVIDPTGAPLEGASVSVVPEARMEFTQDGRQLTDAAGVFELTGLPAEPHMLFIVLDGFVPRSLPVTPGEPPRDVMLKPGALLHGLVLDAATGEAIPRFALHIEGGQLTTATQEEDHEAGRFAASMDGDAACTVTVSAHGYAPQSRMGVLAAKTSADAPLVFRLSAAP